MKPLNRKAMVIIYVAVFVCIYSILNILGVGFYGCVLVKNHTEYNVTYYIQTCFNDKSEYKDYLQEVKFKDKIKNYNNISFSEFSSSEKSSSSKDSSLSKSLST